jgi:vacuolar-type H+-ATPase subunit H
MSGRQRSAKVDSAAAIDLVLAAEQSVRDAMEACRREAQSVLETARDESRRITRRSTGRISRLHARCDTLCAARIDASRRDAMKDAPRAELDDADHEAVALAADRLAARLTSPDDG